MDDPGKVTLGAHSLTLLHRVSRTVSSCAGLDSVLDELAGLAADATGSDASFVYLSEPETGELVLRGWRVAERYVSDGVARKIRGHAETIAAASRRAWSNPSFSSIDPQQQYEAGLLVPLAAGGAALGTLSVHHRAPRDHSPEEVALVALIGEQMGCAVQRIRLTLDNARLHEETLRLKGQLELRKLIERAKGILQRQLGLTEEQAYLRLRNESRRLRKPMAELARSILMDGGQARPREQTRAAG